METEILIAIIICTFFISCVVGYELKVISLEIRKVRMLLNNLQESKGSNQGHVPEAGQKVNRKASGTAQMDMNDRSI